MIEFLLLALVLIPCLFYMHTTLEENRRMNIRTRIIDFYISSYENYREEELWINIILDYCNSKYENPNRICKEFPKSFLLAKPYFERYF